MKNTFGEYHPFVNFIYFVCIIGISMCFMHPLFLVLSLLGAVAYSGYLNGTKAMFFQLRFVLPLMLAAVFLNPLFNHRGGTVLCYLPDGNPMTLESILYGGAMAGMLGAVILWFSCYNSVMNSEKILCLFGKILPALSLIFSMTLRFVPWLKTQTRAIIQAQQGIGRDGYQKSWRYKVRCSVTILSVLFTWALESAVETADSMQSRGYGLKGRTTFSNYCWERRDSVVLCIILLNAGYVLNGILLGGIYFSYFPTWSIHSWSLYEVSVAAAYFILIALPLGVSAMGEYQWKYTQSRI